MKQIRRLTGKDEDALLDVNAFCRALNIGPKLARKWVSEGLVPAHKFGRKYMFTQRTLREILDGTIRIA